MGKKKQKICLGLAEECTQSTRFIHSQKLHHVQTYNKHTTQKQTYINTQYSICTKLKLLIGLA